MNPSGPFCDTWPKNVTPKGTVVEYFNLQLDFRLWLIVSKIDRVVSWGKLISVRLVQSRQNRWTARNIWQRSLFVTLMQHFYKIENNVIGGNNFLNFIVHYMHIDIDSNLVSSNFRGGKKRLQFSRLFFNFFGRILHALFFNLLDSLYLV